MLHTGVGGDWSLCFARSSLREINQLSLELLNKVSHAKHQGATYSGLTASRTDLGGWLRSSCFVIPCLSEDQWRLLSEAEQ